MHLSTRKPFTFIAISLCFFILRMAIPFALFALIISITTTYLIFCKDIIHFFKTIKWKDLQVFLPFSLTILSFVLSLTFDQSKQLIIYKELANIPIIISLLFMFLALVDTKDKIKSFLIYFTKYYTILMGLICILALIKFWLMLKGIHLELLTNHDKYPWGFSLSTDYNFYAVAIFIGFVVLLWRKENLFPKKYRSIEYLFFMLICTNVFYSGSRRGIIILFSILILQFIVSLFQYLNKKKFDRVFLKCILGILVILFQIYFLYFASFPVRKYTGKAINVYALPYKKEITSIAFRYITLFDTKADYKKMFIDMWPREEADQVVKLEDTKEPIYEKTTYGSRLERWKYGIELYTKKYTVNQQIFGKGFSYLKRYAIRFRVILFNSYDYPHNPLIASLLYGGIIGFLLLASYLAFSLFLIYKLKIFDNVLLTSYFIISFFSLLSGNSYFSIPIYVAVTLIPFYLYYVNKLPKNNTNS